MIKLIPAHTLPLLAVFPLAFSLVYSANGLAMSEDSPHDSYLEEIVVTGTRSDKSIFDSPSSISLVNEEDLNRNIHESIAEVLRDIPGVTIVDSGQAGMKRIRIRGEDSYRVAVLIDGQEITDHRGTGVPLTIDPSAVERVEVIKGAGSVLYGSKALGGVINFITRKGGSEPVQMTISTGWDSSTDGTQHSASIYGTVEGFDYRITSNKDEQDDRKTPAGTIDNTQADSDSVSVYLGKTWGSHQLGLTWENHNAYSEVFVEDEVRYAFPFTDFTMDIPQRDRSKVGLFYDWFVEGDTLQKVHFDAYKQESDRQFYTDQWYEDLPYLSFFRKESFSDSTLVTKGALLQLDWDL